MNRAVLLSSQAQREFAALDAKTRSRLKKGLLRFAETGRGDLKKFRGVSGGPDLFRLRLGDFRVIIELAPKEVRVTRVIHHGEGYSWL